MLPYDAIWGFRYVASEEQSIALVSEFATRQHPAGAEQASNVLRTACHVHMFTFLDEGCNAQNRYKNTLK